MTRSTSFEWNGSNAVEKVQLAGSFTQWEPVDMEKNSESGSEKWALKLDLSPGEYEFKFVVDGKWLHNELLPTKTNDVGSVNNVITVEEKALSMSTASSIEAIDEDEIDDDEGWEVIQNPQIEIERKFIVPDNYHERLTAQGFQLQQEFDEVLVDKYYDTNEHALIMEDHWLRQRNGDWELKYPVGLDGHSQGGSTLYHETTCIEEIMTRLRPILKVEEGGCSHLQSLLEKTYLKPFAQLETKRKCYSREDKVNIVIDATDWGHSVGEIEIMVMDHDHITEATSKIETIGAELDFSHMDLKALCSKACK